MFIPYVSAYHKTGVIAEKIAEGIRRAGDVEVVVQDIEKTSMGELDEQITRSSGIIVGSPTITQNILFPIYKLFALINPLRDKGKLAGAFGQFMAICDKILIGETTLRFEIASELDDRPSGKTDEERPGECRPEPTARFGRLRHDWLGHSGSDRRWRLSRTLAGSHHAPGFQVGYRADSGGCRPGRLYRVGLDRQRKQGRGR